MVPGIWEVLPPPPKEVGRTRIQRRGRTGPGDDAQEATEKGKLTHISVQMESALQPLSFLDIHNSCPDMHQIHHFADKGP